MNLRNELTRGGNRFGVWFYLTLDGRFSTSERTPVLVLTSPGRRTGLPRSTCVRYLEIRDGLLVWGTGSGAPRDPDWVRNLRRSPVVSVRRGARQETMQARELHGTERDEAWRDTVLRRFPDVRRYAENADRPIPVMLLTPHLA
jgi:deazaflavin-dependent oxidoreductase (nitroreductase family)